MVLCFFLTGVVLAFGYDDLSKNKVTTQSTTPPLDSRAPNRFVSGNAVDRDRTTCTRTDAIGENSPHQTVWWEVDLGGVYNIYSVNILFKNYDSYERRQQGRFAGFSLFVSDTGDRDNSSLCYKDGPKLPSLNFTTTCITSGRYATFYNERLVRVNYPEEYEVVNVLTELCEVTVQGCKHSGVYGNSCKESCPTNCRDNVCHIEKGTCYGCEPGWMSTTCNTKCRAGWYGVDCKQQCSGHCRNNAICNHVTGQCDGGCAAGWKGNLCITECEDGHFGNNCVHNCSGNCLNDSPCNTQTGHCEVGCKPGYTNALCSKHCVPGYFGYKCANICQGHCLNNAACDRIDGTCIDGCQYGFKGPFCNESCEEGFYGRNCSLVCSSNCRTCKSTDGTCSCYTGWTGSNCSTVCMWSYGEDCQYPCSKHCVHQTCDRFNGSCLSGCDSGYYGPKCEQEYLLRSGLSAVSSGFIGASVTLFMVLTTAFVIFIIRRRKYCFFGRPSISNKESPYAEIATQPSGSSTYQELTVPETNKDYQNLALK